MFLTKCIYAFNYWFGMQNQSSVLVQHAISLMFIDTREMKRSREPQGKECLKLKRCSAIQACFVHSLCVGTAEGWIPAHCNSHGIIHIHVESAAA